MKTTKQIRPAAVSGMFYPDDPTELTDQISAFLNEASYDLLAIPKVLIVPHAGMVYSGSIAASAYRSLLQYRHVIRKVILLGPAHRTYIKGLGLPTVDQFQTSLGEINLDTKTIKNLVKKFPQVRFSDEAHADEHSLEVQMPFLQEVLGSFRLIPFVVGEASQKEVADVIHHLWGGEECLIVISTDLSHFHAYDRAVELDRITAEQIELFRGDKLWDHAACGRIPLSGLLQVAKEKWMSIQRFDLRNSGDTSGRKDQVVGYGAWGLFE